MTIPSELDCPELRIAADAASSAGEIVSGYFRDGIEIRSKESYNLVSDADLEAEQRIVALIRERFPNHAFLAEESHHDPGGADDLWVIDPLDGTNNFAHEIAHFAISIAYYKHGQPQCGVIVNPVRDDWYFCRAGHGAYRNGVRQGVSTAESLAEVLVGVGFYYDRGEMMRSTLRAIEELFGCQIHGIRRFGTASLDLCQVGCGMFGGFFEYHLSPWDFAAGRLFVEEAGGAVSCCRGGKLPLAPTSVLASNKRLHSALLEITARNFPGMDADAATVP